MSEDDYERKLGNEIAEGERGTWRERLRAARAPWFGDLVWGFRVDDGWADLIIELTAEIARITGGPEKASALRIHEVKEKLGGLRVYCAGIPQAHADAVHAAIHAAEQRSFTICEACGAPGELRHSRQGVYHTACDEHAQQ